jgi:purine-binding chemotaxis protein CheW
MNTLNQKSSEQFIIFTLVGETMGIPIGLVREVISLNMFHQYKIPGSAEYYKGVINLRGQVIPIIDAREKLNFGLDQAQVESPKAIILELDKEHFGLVVDTVEEVAFIRNDLIEQAPGPLAGNNQDRKIGKISGKDKDGKDRFVFLLSKETIFGEYETKDSLIPSNIRKILNEVAVLKAE